MTGTSYWYMHTDQWRNDGYSTASLASPLSKGTLTHEHTADAIAQSARMGWMPFYPQFDRNPLDLADEATAAVAAGTNESVGTYVAEKLHEGDLTPAITDVGRPRELATHAGAVAIKPDGVIGQRQRVLPAQPPRHPPQRARHREPADAATERRDVARRSARRQARSAGVRGLPPDVDDTAFRHRRPGRPPGTRNTICRRRTCIRSCTRSLRQSTRLGKPSQTSASSTCSPKGSRSWQRPISACATTWSACRCSTTPRARPPNRMAG